MSKRKAKAPTTKNIVDGTRPLIQSAWRPQTQMYNVNLDYHLFKIVQLIVQNKKFRDGIDKLIRNL